MSRLARRPAVAGTALAVAASLAAGGCGGGSTTPSCTAGTAHSVTAPTAPPKGPAPTAPAQVNPPGMAPGATASGPAAAWTLPGGNLANTRDVASPINSSNVARLGVAWTVPVKAGMPGFSYASTPVVVNGVVYTQDLASDVMAISLATGKVLWTHDYHSPDGGPNGVNVAGGVVYAATATAAVALSAATGAQLWRRTLIHNGHEEINMAPGYDHGTVYVSSSPVSTRNEYAGHGSSALWALNASTGVPEWSWDEVQNLWGKPAINSGGGQWYPPSFDSQGNLYLGVANPGPESGHPGYPWGTSRPGPDLYTDSVVKLSPRGKLLWYYQLTPHDVHDWDLQDPPVLTTAAGQPVVIDGGKAGVLAELNARTGKLIWKLPVGAHNGHDNDGLLTEHARPGAHIHLRSLVCVEPGGFGGIESQLASNGSAVFAAVNNLPMLYQADSGATVPGGLQGLVTALNTATGEMVAVNQATGAVLWQRKFPSSPYGAAAVTNNVVFTTTYAGDLYALNAATGAVLLRKRMPAGSNAPVAIDGGYVIAGAGVGPSPLIIAYRLGARGKLPAAGGLPGNLGS